MSARHRFDVTGKVAIVTGSTEGIGRATVQGLAEAGASVVVSSRKQKRVGDPEEIVGPVVYLASDASSFVMGDDISVSGGMPK